MRLRALWHQLTVRHVVVEHSVYGHLMVAARRAPLRWFRGSGLRMFISPDGDDWTELDAQAVALITAPHRHREPDDGR